MKRIVSIKEYKEMNGRQVPIYKTSWISKADYKKAEEEVARRITEANKDALQPEELVEVLQEHAAATAGTPDQLAGLAKTLEEQDNVILYKKAPEIPQL